MHVQADAMNDQTIVIAHQILRFLSRTTRESNNHVSLLLTFQLSFEGEGDFFTSVDGRWSFSRLRLYHCKNQGANR